MTEVLSPFAPEGDLLERRREVVGSSQVVRVLVEHLVHLVHPLDHHALDGALQLRVRHLSSETRQCLWVTGLLADKEARSEYKRTRQHTKMKY